MNVDTCLAKKQKGIRKTHRRPKKAQRMCMCICIGCNAPIFTDDDDITDVYSDILGTCKAHRRCAGALQDLLDEEFETLDETRNNAVA